MVNWIMFGKIQEYKREHLNKSQVSRKMGIDYKTISKYWNMSPEDYAVAKDTAATRTKKADIYKDFILECLRKYPDMSSAQIYDWVKERTNKMNLNFSERSCRNYVKHLREEYDIPKPESSRQYQAVEEKDFGKQAQVDMGEIILKTPTGKSKKVYCFAMVLSCSRYKYIVWQDRPFTTDSFIRAHIKAFTFLGGRPDEMVYDQDKILAVSENHGDIIYTEGFQNYINEVKFKVYLCRGADPESKGKVENVVKYAKHGFAEHRTYTDIVSFNEDCIRWLNRTANAKIHDTIKQIPADVFAQEKEYLKPVSEYSFEKTARDIITYQVRKDNLVIYKGNRYRVPLGTYKPGKKVTILINKEVLSIVDVETGEIYAKHPICHDKGKLIGNLYTTRDNSKTILQLENKLKQRLNNPEGFNEYLNQLHKERARYYRDQLGIINQICDDWTIPEIVNGISYCVERELYSAGELKSAITYLSINVSKEKNKTTLLPEKYRGNSPAIRDLSVYEDIMERRTVNG